MSQKLILIDAYGFIFRAYYVFPKLYNSQNISLGAIYGFASMLIRLILEMQSNKIIVVFDSGGKNFRHEIYPDYKANRIDIDKDLKDQLAIAKTIPESLGIPCISISGFEADDIIATFTKKYESSEIVIVSSDKDLMQLINSNITMYDPLKKKYITTKEVLEKFEVEPNKLKDFLAIVGDKSDNIPGIKGAGPKAAIALLNEFSSLDNILQNIQNIKPISLQNKVALSKENAILSQQLITLNFEAPIENFNTIYINLNIEKAVKYFKELEFNSLLSKISQLENKYKTNSIEVKLNIDTQEVLNTSPLNNNKNDSLKKDYKIIQLTNLSENNLNEILQYFKIIGVCIIDVKSNNILLASRDVIYSLATPTSIAIENLLFELMSDSSINIICYNIKNLLNCFKFKGRNIKICNNINCLNIMHYILYGSSLSYYHFANILKKTEYQEEYIIYAYDLYSYFMQKLIKENLLSIYQLIDIPISYILFSIEDNGIEIDIDLLQICSLDLDKRLKVLEQKIYQLAGEEFNINSPKQLSAILFDKLNLNFDNNKKKYSTDIEILEKLKENGVLIAEFLIKWRELSKLKNTYTTGLQKFIVNNKIHTTLDQTGTATARLSSYNPNLQNIPIKSFEAENLRNCFIANRANSEEELVFISSDYSQIELRLLAVISNSSNLLDAFAKNKDIHLDTAAKIFNVPHENVTKEQRQKAKTINFGIIYGMGQFGLAKKLNITNNEAKIYIEKFFHQYPEIQKYMDTTILYAQENGFVKNMFGRKCFLQTNLSSSFLNRAAINFPVQSSASDIIKTAMIKLQNKFIIDKLPIKCVLQVHDELIFTTPKKYHAQSIEHIKNIMQIDSFNSSALINDLLKDNLKGNSNKSIPILVNIAASNTFFFNK